MKVFGQFMRFFLNINTIWGLMILTAFVLCVVQHYQATTTRIPGDYLAEGENKVTIRVLGSDEEVCDFEYTLTRQSATLMIPSDDQKRQADRPWLIAATSVETGFALESESIVLPEAGARDGGYAARIIRTSGGAQ